MICYFFSLPSASERRSQEWKVSALVRKLAKLAHYNLTQITQLFIYVTNQILFLFLDITVICPWEAYSHLELHELAQYGII